jgi:hypothetical protein
MSQNITWVNTSKRKQSEVREREAAVDEIENEITMLTKNHHEIRDRLKSLKASKTDLRKRKSSSKAESSSSGRIRTMASSAKLKKVSLATKVGSKKCMSLSYCLFFLFRIYGRLISITPAEIKTRKDSSTDSLSESFNSSSSANQGVPGVASTSQVGDHMEVDFTMGDDVPVSLSMPVDGLNFMSDSESGAYFLSSIL